MALLSTAWNTLRFVVRHPLNRDHALRALSGFVRWQLGSRLVPGPVLVPFVEGTQIFARPGLAGATGTVYVGLHDFEDMAFLLHLLRPGDRFADIGANVGTYSILAAGVVGADVTAFEPAPAALKWLKLNALINGIGDRMDVREVALGRQPGQVAFTKELDTVNHVAVATHGQSQAEATTIVPVDTLDHVLGATPPTLLKLDVEGFEREVLEGGSQTLRSKALLAVIIEINGSGARYGHSDADIDRALTSAGLSPHAYDPLSRTLRPLATHRTSGNTLYVRSQGEIEARVKTARRFRVGRFRDV